MPDVNWITTQLLAEVADEARSAPRRRKNRNLHRMEDPVHRLLNAVEPGTYIRPHRHLAPPKTETALVLAGRIGMIVFDDAGNVTTTAVLDAHGEVRGADIEPGAWHTFVALAPGSVFFEAKPGPYVAPGPADLAAWAPAEGDSDAEAAERGFRSLFG